MPGIVGIISKEPAERNRRDIKMMVNALMHKTTYRSGIYEDEEAGLYLGFVSHQGAFDDFMPVSNEKGDIVLIFSGEAFNDAETVKALAIEGHAFKDGSADYLVHLYEKLGDRFFENINGWFCGVIVDKRIGQATLFNDRYGMKRLYYSCSDGVVRFSSEAKALMGLDGAPRAFDDQGLIDYFACGAPLQNRTLFKDILLIPGASRWVIREKRIVSKLTYFRQSAWENKEILPPELFYSRLHETFRRILPRYLRPRPTIGLSLTGGLDTRMIMANARLEPRQVPCYTFSGMYRDCYDATVARKIAAICGQGHKTLRLDQEFLREFPRYAEEAIRISEGAIDLNAASELFLNELAREIALVRLTGNYGSEVLRRVRLLKGASKPSAVLHPDFHPGILQTKALIDELYAKHPLTFTLFSEGPWHEYGRYAVESSQLVVRTPYTDNDLISLMYQAPPEGTSSKALSIRLITDGNRALIHIPTDRGYPLNGRSAGKTVRRYYSEFLYKADFHLGTGAHQWVEHIVHSFAFLGLERMFLGRHKFNHFRPWFRNELSGFVKEILLDRRALSRPYFNSKHIEQMVNLHMNDRGNFTQDIQQALTLELTNRLLLES
jgi:asparagine synthase (glutamine-hydrolysing)